jgi:hypothetical protein
LGISDGFRGLSSAVVNSEYDFRELNRPAATAPVLTKFLRFIITSLCLF